MKNYVVAGIGTGIGKTLVSAVMVEALEADYWKPIQAGTEEGTDSESILGLVSNLNSVVHPEAYILSQPMSPHAAAKIDGVTIELDRLRLPRTTRSLVVELAGGIMVPFSDTELNIDLLKLWNLPVVLVSENYLGSINHTLLTVHALKNGNIPIAGIVFNGHQNTETEKVILGYTGLTCLARIPRLPSVDRAAVRAVAKKFLETWK